MGGPQPGTGCLVCTSPEVSLINAALNAGVLSGRSIARKFNLPKDSVARHRYKRHPGVEVVGSPSATGDTEDRSLLDRLKDQRIILEDEMKRSPKADISRELRQVQKDIDEIEGTNRPKLATVTDVEGLADQVARWFEALEPYPEAREAMFLATDRALLEAARLVEES